MKLASKDTGDFSNKNRLILTRLLHHMLQIHTPEDPEFNTTKIILSISKGSARPMAIDLTRLTEKELIAFRETVLIATEAAQPICAELDQRAQEAMRNGDDSDTRSYRPVPVVLVKPRALRQYDKRLLDRREDVLQGVNVNVMQPDGVSGPGGEVDESVQGTKNGSEDGS